MPWCPKCKTEYREGFLVCADCGSGLVKEQPVEEKRTGSFWAASDERFFSEGEEDRSEESDLEEDWPEEPDGEDRSEESGLEEDQPEASDGKQGQGQAKTSGQRKAAGGLYQDSSERASENRSSAWILLAMGSFGLAAEILCVTGVIRVDFGNPYLLYGVMGAVFLLFVVAGVVSMKNAKFFEKKAESENSLRGALLDWCKENLDAAQIDGRIGAQGIPEEILYFRRVLYIKEKLNHQFVNLDQGFLDRLIDELVYEMVFGA